MDDFSHPFQEASPLEIAFTFQKDLYYFCWVGRWLQSLSLQNSRVFFKVSSSYPASGQRKPAKIVPRYRQCTAELFVWLVD